MATLPTVNELQRAIAQTWKAAGIQAPAPCAIETQVYYNPRFGYVAIALVIGPSGNSYRVPPHTVETVDIDCQDALPLIDCRIGECIRIADRTLMLIARDGGAAPGQRPLQGPPATESAPTPGMTPGSEADALAPGLLPSPDAVELPDPDTCDDAFDRAFATCQRSERLLAIQDRLGYLLREHRLRLEADTADFSRHADETAILLAQSHRQAIGLLERRLSELIRRHALRSLPELGRFLTAETEALQALRDEARRMLDDAAAEMSPHRERHAAREAEAMHGANSLASERRRLEAAYVAALRDPTVLLLADATKELQEILRQKTSGDGDLFCLQRRLFALRAHATHSSRQPTAGPRWPETLAAIDQAIAELKAVRE